MRIVHVADFVSTELGYQELLLAKWNVRHGHDVHIVTSNLNPPSSNYAETFAPLLGPRHMQTGTQLSDGVTIHRLPARLELRDRIVLRHLSATLDSLTPDVILCHGTASPTAFTVARFCRRRSVPLLMDNHMVFSVQDTSLRGKLFYFGLRQAVRRLLTPYTYRFLGVATECCEFLERAEGIPPDQIDLLPLGVDAELFDYLPSSRETVRRELGVERDSVVILQTGKFGHEKRPQLLAEAACSLLRDHSASRLLFVGAGPKDVWDQIQQIAREKGVESQVVRAPMVPARDLARYFSAADIVAFPGGTSLSCLEAAACERPVVMTDQPANRWRSSLGIGVTFRDGDVNDLESVLSELLHDGGRRRRIGSAARIAVLNHFSYDAVASLSEEFMNAAVGAMRDVAKMPLDQGAARGIQ